MGYEIKFSEFVDIEITINGDNKDDVFEAGRGLQIYLEGIFDGKIFRIQEAHFHPYIIRVGCPTTENIKALAETIEGIVKGFLEDKKKEV